MQEFRQPFSLILAVVQVSRGKLSTWSRSFITARADSQGATPRVALPRSTRGGRSEVADRPPTRRLSTGCAARRVDPRINVDSAIVVITESSREAANSGANLLPRAARSRSRTRVAEARATNFVVTCSTCYRFSPALLSLPFSRTSSFDRVVATTLRFHLLLLPQRHSMPTESNKQLGLRFTIARISAPRPGVRRGVSPFFHRAIVLDGITDHQVREDETRARIRGTRELRGRVRDVVSWVSERTNIVAYTWTLFFLTLFILFLFSNYECLIINGFLEHKNYK